MVTNEGGDDMVKKFDGVVEIKIIPLLTRERGYDVIIQQQSGRTLTLNNITDIAISKEQTITSISDLNISIGVIKLNFYRPVRLYLHYSEVLTDMETI